MIQEILKNRTALFSILLTGLFSCAPLVSFAQISITEIMYDPEGADASAGSEWIEVKNESTGTIDLSTWFFFEANTNHGLMVIDGGNELEAGGFAVISKDPASFKNFFTSFSGHLFKSSFSLGDSETLGMKSNKDAVVVSSIAYTSDWGAKNDGKSLQKSATGWLAAAPTPAHTNVTSLAQPSNPGTASSDDDTDKGATSTSAGTEIVVSKIYAEAPDDKTALALADTGFRGQAYNLQKEPMANARYIWNFGDGATGEGQTVLHSYIYPGEYLVHLYVASGEYTASDTLKVKVIASPLFISDVSYDGGGSITVENGSDEKLDVSFWKIKSGQTLWSFPKDSYILPKSAVVVSGLRSGLSILQSNEVLLLYPNHNFAFKYEYRPKSMPRVSMPAQTKPVATTAIKSNTSAGVSAKVSGSYAEVVDAKQKIAAAEIAPDNKNLITKETLSSASVANSAQGGGVLKWLVFLGGFLGVVIFSLFYFKEKLPGTPALAENESEGLQADDFDIEEEL